MTMAGPTGTLRRLGEFVRGHSRLVGAGGAAVVAGIAAVVTGRGRSERLALPDPAVLATEAAVSVHNAAKGAVIAATRESDAPDEQLVMDAVRDAVLGGGESGADVTAAVIGAVEGAADVAHHLCRRSHELGAAAAAVAAETARLQGKVAGDRAWSSVASLLDRLGSSTRRLPGRQPSPPMLTPSARSSMMTWEPMFSRPWRSWASRS